MKTTLVYLLVVVALALGQPQGRWIDAWAGTFLVLLTQPSAGSSGQPTAGLSVGLTAMLQEMRCCPPGPVVSGFAEQLTQHVRAVRTSSAVVFLNVEN